MLVSFFQVVESGISLAFVTYPTAVLEMDGPPVWSFLFFFMLICLALSSICAGAQALVTSVTDEKPSLARYRVWIILGFCSVSFLLGLPLCFQGGFHLFTLIDSRMTTGLLLANFLQLACVSWFYGINRVMGNMREMGMSTPLWKKILLWLTLGSGTPLVLGLIAVLSWFYRSPVHYGDYIYPDSVQNAGWVLELMPSCIALVFPVWTVYRVRRSGVFWSDMKEALLKPTASWYLQERGDQPQVEPLVEEQRSVSDKSELHL